ncbi:MAG TPA: NYN domain-containing protein [Isosphaeraceae bacterium]|nr:NYN domain-containing protein [Isosphaeraceae bacterium]
MGFPHVGVPPATRTSVAFVDVGYLKNQGRRTLKLADDPALDAKALWQWAMHAWTPSPTRFLRAYLYDGAFDPSHPDFRAQRDEFNALARQPYTRLRLGHVVVRGPIGTPTGLQQKGVDTFLVLDLLRMAQTGTYDVALLVAGDRDFVEAIRVVQDELAREVILWTPTGAHVHEELIHVADHWGEIEVPFLQRILPPAGQAASPAPQGGALGSPQ